MIAAVSCLLFSLAGLLGLTDSATIVFAGDAMQHRSQLDASKRAGGKYDYSGTFDAIAPWVRQADYAVVNLETPLGKQHFTGYPCFCAPAAFASALQKAGFDLFLTANNHTLDRSDAGLNHTIAVLDSLGADHTGTYRDAETRAATAPFVKNINGFKVAFINCTYGTNGIKPRGKAQVDMLSAQNVAKDIAAARKAGAEIVIVMPHWGDEYRLYANAGQKRLANRFFDAGADAVIGGHPHVVQPMTIDSANRPLVYSMGNFISGMRTTDTRGGAMVRLTLKRDIFRRAYIEDAQYRLVFTVPGIAGKRAHRVVFVDQTQTPDSLGTQTQTQSRAFVANAVRALSQSPDAIKRFKPANAQNLLQPYLRQ